MPSKKKSSGKGEKDVNSMSKSEIDAFLRSDSKENKFKDNVSAGSFVVFLFPAFLIAGLPVYVFIFHSVSLSYILTSTHIQLSLHITDVCVELKRRRSHFRKRDVLVFDSSRTFLRCNRET